MESVMRLDKVEDVQSVIDYCQNICSVIEDVDQIEMYMDIIDSANIRIQALKQK